MGNNRPVKKKYWIRFLIAHGCEEQKRKTGTSHVFWKCPNCIRTIVFRNQNKEIPFIHLKTNLDTMGYDLNYLYDWLDGKNPSKKEPSKKKEEPTNNNKKSHSKK